MSNFLGKENEREEENEKEEDQRENYHKKTLEMSPELLSQNGCS